MRKPALKHSARDGDSARDHRAPTSRQCLLELQRILTSRVFTGGSVAIDDGKKRRFKRSQTHRALLERLVRKALAGKPVSADDVTDGRARSSKYVHTTINRLGTRLEDYYRFEGFANPIRIKIFMRLGQVCVQFSAAMLHPADQEYERAVYHLNRHSPENTEKALDHVQRAIRLDGRHAAAHAALAEALLTKASHTYTESPKPLLEAAHTAAQTAVALDPELWRAHAALGTVYEWNLEFAKAKAAFDNALERDSYGLWDYDAYYGFLIAIGKIEEGVRLAEAYQRQRPADPLAHSRYATCLHLAGRHSDAERALQEALALDPNLWLAHITLVLVYLELGRFADALRQIEPIAHGAPDAWPGLYVICLAATRNTAKARNELARLEKRVKQKQYVQPLQFALAYVGMRRFERAVEFLGHACDERHPVLDWVHLWPVIEPVRKLKSYRTLLKRLKMPPAGHMSSV